MDNAGWHAQRRADKDSYRYFSRRHRGSDGQYVPEVVVGPLPHGQLSTQSPSDYASRPSNISSSAMHNIRLAEMPPAERAKAQRIPQMSPLLQFMVGPLLRYDTIDMNGVWHGAALIVTADAGSFYDPVPVLTYQWDPEEPTRTPNSPTSSTFSKYELSPHPADPHATTLLSREDVEKIGKDNEGGSKGCAATIDQTQRVIGQEIYVYSGRSGTFTFWRFPIRIQLGANELCIKYSINGGIQLSFCVPAFRQNMRWATYSCNGFSAGVNSDDFRGPGFKSGYDPMWVDLLQKHSQEPFHVLVGGGDQLYCDSVTREPELQDWVHAQTGPSKLAHSLTPEIAECIDRFLFNHYCASFRHGAFARANSSIPMLNMCDLIDGFGSYPDDLQSCPIFQAIGARGYFFFLLFQCFINPYLDGLDDRPGRHPFKSLILGFQGPFVGLPSHSFLAPLGPNVHILMLDCRAERRKDRVCSDAQYRKMYDHIKQLPSSVEHLIVQLGIPIAYPRLVFLETALDSKLNPLISLGRNRTLGLSGLVNKFNSEAELLDDLNDHWTAKVHKKERNFFIQELQGIAKMKRLRITFLSGDVHCAAVGVLKTYTGGKNNVEVPPSVDFRYMINIVTSAIVNTPPPVAVIRYVHKTLHYAQTDETMVTGHSNVCQLFTHEPDGTVRSKNKYIMGRRNWCAVRWDGRTGEVMFDLRVETEKGLGTSVGYEVRVPPPQWAPGP
ncbi:hypothetical protein EDD16DRAFT_1885290 [Pisolithus croceorrhizus]|nr:hypothetical protein EDD16DRAFT_1885290 [Pisolithus croceorrhizus]